MGNFSHKTGKALPFSPPPPPDRPALTADPDPERRNNDARGRESSPARGAPGLTGDLAAARTARPPVSGTQFFPPPNIETVRARPRSPEHPAPGGRQSRSSRRGSDPGSPESRQWTGREGAPGWGTGGNGRNSYGAQFLPECSRSRARPGAPTTPAPAPATRRCVGRPRDHRALHLSPHTLSAPRRWGRRRPPRPLAPRQASVAPTFAQLGRRSFPAPHSGPATCLASRVGVVTAPRTARFLLSPPSHLPPNLLPTPAPRPPPRHGIRRGRPQCLSSRPRPSPARPVRPQRWAGGWAAAAAAAEAAAAAAEAARSTIVFLTLCAPTLRLFPFLPPPVPPPPALHSQPTPPQPTAVRASPTRLAPRRPPAARSSGGLGAVATAARLEAPPT
ncbi:transcription initiation factor TFIID subunit 4-like [Pseudorca crassidens]|uniref:transcription initiation factor TFIID subunit 4-like n=1 Tax=Pseudorca crassidens TaxID=82174 RepID=UPI00352C8B49